MAVPAIYNWCTDTRGDSLPSQTFTVDTPSISLTGASIRMQVRDRRGEALVDLRSPGSGIDILSPKRFRVNSFKVLNAYGSLPYDIEITFSDGKTATYIKGSIPLKKDTTHE